LSGSLFFRQPFLKRLLDYQGSRHARLVRVLSSLPPVVQCCKPGKAGQRIV
jgi:hypothetical protein